MIKACMKKKTINMKRKRNKKDELENKTSVIGGKRKWGEN